MLSVSSPLVPSVSDDEIADELADGLVPEEAAELHAARLHLAALEDEASRAAIPADGERSRRRAGDPRDLIEAAARVAPVTLAREQVLAVLDEVAPLLPDGALRRGSIVSVGGSGGAGGVAPVGVLGGATALALSLVVAASAQGSWTAMVGLPMVGLAAVAEAGISLERVAVIATPPPEQWATAVAALVGAFDLVLIPVPPAARLGEVRRLTARARERGSVLIQLTPFDATGPATTLDADVRLVVTGSRWEGLSRGAGHLRTRRLTVEAVGRRGASRPRRLDLWLPGLHAAIATAELPPNMRSDAVPGDAGRRMVAGEEDAPWSVGWG